MQFSRIPARFVALLAALPVAAQALHAQAPAAVTHDTACSYERCALGIVPAWNGLAVVRGVDERQVTVLHFFIPRDVSQAIAGTDSSVVGATRARAEGYHAFQLRRAAAGFTDGGALLVAVAGISALRAGHMRRQDAVIAGAGAAALAISVPLQFAADGALSRAVWWYNRRFAH